MGQAAPRIHRSAKENRSADSAKSLKIIKMKQHRSTLFLDKFMIISTLAVFYPKRTQMRKENTINIHKQYTTVYIAVIHIPTKTGENKHSRVVPGFFLRSLAINGLFSSALARSKAWSRDGWSRERRQRW